MTMAVLKLKSSDGTYLNYTLDKPITTLGRSKTNDIIVDDTSISRLHVRIENRNGQYFVIDNNSSNGTYLNRRKVSTAPLQDGDTLIAGQVQFHFSHKVIGGMKTQALPLIDADENPSKLNQTLAVNFANVGGDDHPLAGPPQPPSPAVSMPPADVPPPTPFQQPTPPEPIAAPQPIPTPEPPPAWAEPSAYDAPPAPPMPPPSSTPGLPSTPEPQASSMPYQTMLDPELFDVASPFTRLIAIVLDVLLMFLLFIPSIAMTFLEQALLGSLLGLLPMIAWFVNYIGGGLKYGKTIGKHLMGIRIVDLDHPQQQGLSFVVLLKRLVGMMICGFTMNLLYLTILFDDEGRGFHDKFANTKVVKY